MILDDSMQHEAEERAEKLLSFRTEGDKWNVLEDLLTEELAKQRDLAIQDLAVEIVRDRLYPGITKDQWSKLGWSKVRGGGAPIAPFIHKLRLARASGSTTGKL